MQSRKEWRTLLSVMRICFASLFIKSCIEKFSSVVWRTLEWKVFFRVGNSFLDSDPFFVWISMFEGDFSISKEFTNVNNGSNCRIFSVLESKKIHENRIFSTKRAFTRKYPKDFPFGNKKSDSRWNGGILVSKG